MNKRRLTKIAGGLWSIIGFVLVIRGLDLYRLAELDQHSTKIAITISGIVAVLIGLIKGKFVLSKTAPSFQAGGCGIDFESLSVRTLDTTPYLIRTYQDPLPRQILILGCQALT